MERWIFELIESGGYFGIFCLMMLETVFPPIPSEVIMPVAGVSAARGSMSLAGVIAAGTGGAMAGNLFWYGVARAVGLDRFGDFIARHGRWLTLDCYDVERTRRIFGRFGSSIVFFGRMVPTIRSVVSIPADLARMRLHRFLLWSTIGTAMWSAVLAAAGWFLGRQFGRIDQVLGPVSTGVVILLAAIYVWRQLTWHRRH
jgi:membrane protein DedA with SNARE-associated domain